MNEDTRPWNGRTDRRSGGEGSADDGGSTGDEAASESQLRPDGGSRDEREDQDPVEEPVKGPTDDPVSEQMGEAAEEEDANVARSQAFHEASGSFRDVGIAILILLVLALIVWILFVL